MGQYWDVVFGLMLIDGDSSGVEMNVSYKYRYTLNVAVQYALDLTSTHLQPEVGTKTTLHYTVHRTLTQRSTSLTRSIWRSEPIV